MRILRVIVMAAVLSAGAGMVSPAVAADCSIPPHAARKLIASNNLLRPGQARKIVASRVSGKIFYVRFCKSGSSFFYSVNVMQGGGSGKKLTTVRVNARSGALN